MTTTNHAASKDAVIAPQLVVSVFEQAWENVRHIRNERIWFGNIYVAVIAGGLAILPRDIADSHNPMGPTMLLGVLVLFSIVSLLSSIRLVVELKQAMTNLQRIVDEHGMGRLVGVIDVRRGFGASMPIRWVFPVFYSLTTASLLFLLIEPLVR